MCPMAKQPRNFMPSSSLLDCKLPEDKNSAVLIFSYPSDSTQDLGQSRKKMVA